MGKSVDKLRGMLIVCDEPEEITEAQYQEYFKALNDAKKEITDYVSRIMGIEQYYFKLNLPSKNAECAQINSNNLGDILELVYLPFGVFSINVWNKLRREDKEDNPVYQLLDCLDFETRAIRTFLSVRGVSPDEYMTTELLNKHGILDVFSLHGFEHVYTDAVRYFETDDSEALGYTE